MVSRLPIRYGDSVRIVLLIDATDDRCEQDHASGFCGTTDLWAPRCLPLRGTYDDYGRVKLNGHPVNIIGANILQEHFNLNINAFLNRSRNPLKVDKKAAGCVMIHEDIYSALTENSDYAGALDWLKTTAEFVASTTVDSRMMVLRMVSNGIYSQEPPSDFERSLGWLDRSSKFYPELIAEKLSEGTSPEDPSLIVLAKELAEFVTFSLWLSTSRTHWAPQCGSGSQNDSVEGQVALANAVLAHAVNRKVIS